jgi:hypothetical protein
MTAQVIASPYRDDPETDILARKIELYNDALLVTAELLAEARREYQERVARKPAPRRGQS